MKVSIRFAWSGIEIRLRRKRKFLRRRAEPILATVGYDEPSRLLAHDAMALGQLTVNFTEAESEHVLAALRHQQLGWSESFMVAEETASLDEAITDRLPTLVKARESNQVQLARLDMSQAHPMTLQDAARLSEQRLQLNDDIRAISQRLRAARHEANDIVTILEIGQKQVETGGDFANETMASAKQSRVQRELGKLYICRTKLTELMASLTQLDETAPSMEIDERRATADVSPSATVVEAGNTICFRCRSETATIPLDSCHHVGLCSSCATDRRWRRWTKCLTCHEQVDSIVQQL